MRTSRARSIPLIPLLGSASSSHSPPAVVAATAGPRPPAPGPPRRRSTPAPPPTSPPRRPRRARSPGALLEKADASTKLLLIVSDGRPYDLDYGQQYGDDAVLRYAVGDTAQALDEARRRGVRPYLITVDPAGADYLGAMCDPREYHVIADAYDLPAALASLYVVARAA